MNRNSFLRIALPALVLPLALAAAQSCASAGSAPSPRAADARAAPAKVAKERTAIVEVPVLVKATRFYSDGLVDQYVAYKLSDDLLTLLEESTYDGARPGPIQRIAYAYEDGRRVRESVYESAGELRSRKEISYDAAGRVASETTFDAKGAAVSSVEYYYNTDGSQAQWIARDGSGAAQAIVSYRYEEGRLESVLMAGSRGEAAGSVALDYGPGGLLAARRYLDASGAPQKSEAYAYAGGFLSSIEYRRADGSPSSRPVFELGPSGERLSETRYDRAGGVTGRTKYEYKVRAESRTETYYE